MVFDTMVIFSSFSPVHEKCLSGLVTGTFSAQSIDHIKEVAEALSALETCRSEIVGKLKEASGAQLRQGLGLLYEALCIVIDFVINLRAEMILRGEFLSNSGEGEPYELGI